MRSVASLYTRFETNLSYVCLPPVFIYESIVYMLAYINEYPLRLAYINESIVFTLAYINVSILWMLAYVNESFVCIYNRIYCMHASMYKRVYCRPMYASLYL